MILLNNYFDTKRELELDLRHSSFIAYEVPQWYLKKKLYFA